MLGLQCESNSAWIARVKDNAAILLADHAHCEKKAALMAISLLHRYSDKTELVEAMTDLAIEELHHFALVTKKMKERGLSLLYDEGDNYAQLLNDQVRKQEPQRFLDRLIVASLIEARSCERFQLLANTVADGDLRAFYSSLLASEARHRTLFLNIARRYFPAEEVTVRLDQLKQIEASLVQALESKATMHG